jgi:hypothetical protein
LPSADRPAPALNLAAEVDVNIKDIAGEHIVRPPRRIFGLKRASIRLILRAGVIEVVVDSLGRLCSMTIVQRSGARVAILDERRWQATSAGYGRECISEIGPNAAAFAHPMASDELAIP